MLENQSKEFRGSPISELAASIASKLARNGALPSDPPHAGVSVLTDDGFTLARARQNEIPAPQEVAQMSHRDPLRTYGTADEYRGRAEACLNWAREALTDEVRLACLTLANAWLKAAISEDGGVSEHLPLAPRL